MTCLTTRFFYYGPFKITNGAVIAAGLSYNGSENGKNKWDKINSMEIIGFECSTSIVDALRGWNHQIHLWLKYYI
jgi:hypothetical protein